MNPRALSELRRTTGQLLVVGFPAGPMPDEVRVPLARGERGGVILFRRNLPDLQSSLELCETIASLTARGEPHAIISVDQEGGRVRRLPFPPIVQLPSMRELGQMDDTYFTARVASVVASQLRDLGFNLNFAPIADVDSNPQNPVIGDRSFGPDPGRVIAHAGAFMDAHQRAGVGSCLKHFPGHGDTDTDSHLALPVVRRPMSELERLELTPFRALADRASAIMSAHVIFEALAPRTPATLNRQICTQLLRNELHFSGVLFSDDMEMRAVAELMPIEESVVAAVHAGCDALLLCHDLQLQSRAHDALLARAERDSEFRVRCEQAAERVRTHRVQFPLAPARPFPAQRVAAESAQLEAELHSRLSKLNS